MKKILNFIILNLFLYQNIYPMNWFMNLFSYEDEKEKNENLWTERYRITEELFSAIDKNDIELIRKHIQNNSYLDGHGGCDGRSTVLMHACSRGRLEIVKLLLNAGANMKSTSEFGYDALFFSVLHNQIESAKLLIAAGANINIQSVYGISLLMQAVMNKNAEMVRMLLDVGINIHLEDCTGSNILVRMAQKNSKEDYDSLEFCIVHDNSLDFNESEIFKLLIEKGINLELKDCDAGNNVLNWAIYKNKENLVRVLINFDINLDSRNKNREVTSQLAKDSENLEIISLLKLKVGEYKQIIYKALKNNNLEQFKKYILKIGTICFKDEDGNNLLHKAILANNLYIFGLIFYLNKKLLYQKNNLGVTPLDLAIIYPSNITKKIMELIEKDLEKYEIKQCVVCFNKINRQEINIACKHNSFHKNCLKNWIKNSNECPICRSKIIFLNINN